MLQRVCDWIEWPLVRRVRLYREVGAIRGELDRLAPEQESERLLRIGVANAQLSRARETALALRRQRKSSRDDLAKALSRPE